MIDDRQGLFVVDGIFQTLIYLFIFLLSKWICLENDLLVSDLRRPVLNTR
jgi:hypothetical protein